MTLNRFTPLLWAVYLLVFPSPPSRGQERPIALKGATIETVAEAGRIESGILVLRGGKVEIVGSMDKVTIPEDALVVDTSGKTIMPGIVEPSFSSRGTLSGSSGTVVIGGEVVTLTGSSPTRTPTFSRAADLFDPYRGDFSPLLRSGLIHLNLIPPEYGQSAVIRNFPDEPEASIVERDGRLFVALSNSTPTLDVLRRGLQEGSRGSNRRSAEAGDSGRGSDDPAADRPGASVPSRPSDPSRALWRDVVEGKSPLMVDVGNAAAILYLLDAIEEYQDVQVALIASGRDVYLTLDQLADRKSVTLLLRPTIDTMPQNRDLINVPRMVHERGLELAFTQGMSRAGLRSGQDTPLFDVGYLIATGLPREIALQALTSRPAELIGLGDSLGRIEEGMSASLLIFDGEPFDPYSRLRTVLVEGRTVYETD